MECSYVAGTTNKVTVPFLMMYFCLKIVGTYAVGVPFHSGSCLQNVDTIYLSIEQSKKEVF